MGSELDVAKNQHIIVENGYIVEVSNGWLSKADYTGGLAIPLPVNAHIHINDYRVLDNHYGYSLSNYAGSRGIKHSLIKLYREPLITEELINTLLQYSIIIDYQELPDLCTSYTNTLREYDINYIGLSRPYSWNNLSELYSVLDKCSGFGISNPTHIPQWLLKELSIISRKSIVSSHISETEYMEKTGGLHYLLNNNIELNHIVHGVYLEDWEYSLLSELNIPLVVTPRSNLWFLNKLPNIFKALEKNITIALGTDNAGCFHPDIWIEAYILTYLLKIPISKVFEITLINGYKTIDYKPIVIEEGSRAYFMVIDLGLANTRSSFPEFSVINRILWSKRKIIVKSNKLYVLETNRHLNTGLNI